MFLSRHYGSLEEGNEFYLVNIQNTPKYREWQRGWRGGRSVKIFMG